MLSRKYTSNQLITILENLFQENSNGILYLKTDVQSWRKQRAGILILRRGALVYGGTQVPQVEELCKGIGKDLKSNLINTALPVAIKRVKDPNSIREILELLVKLNVFTWQGIEDLMRLKVERVLEKFIDHSGELTLEPHDNFDLSYGKNQHSLNWTDIQQKLRQRQQQWQNYAPQIPSMDAVPVVTTQQLRLINNPQVKEHFKNSVDGSRSLVDIAEKMGKDPLKVAKSYVDWVSKGWVSFVSIPATNVAISEAQQQISASVAQTQAKPKHNTATPNQTQANQHLPIVLSVDDSAIIQLSIKRALQDHYQVLLANSAAQALEIMNQSKIELMLLDLTMPDVDGLEFCKTIRAMTKFHDLPIVMVTARDGLVNKMKGRIAGTSKYLTKPFEAEELRQVVAQCLRNQQTITTGE
ncbi:MAG: response regulator [Cyanobacteria bacterium P01_G01_bin.39]